MMGYLAVTAGVGCAASVAEGAIVVVDLSGLSVTHGTKTFTGSGMDGLGDVDFLDYAGFGRLDTASGVRFLSDGTGLDDNSYYARGYSGGATANFPVNADTIAAWRSPSGTSGSGFGVGENWVALRDSSHNFGWMSFTLNSLGLNNTLPITSFGKFVFDDTSTSPANAITLQAAVAAAAIPEPSSLVLLALGATGLAARRQRKKAA